MEEVRVIWGMNRWGELKIDEVLRIRDVKTGWRAWEEGGRSQREDPGMIS
jgi:hypothetical protein